MPHALARLQEVSEALLNQQLSVLEWTAQWECCAQDLSRLPLPPTLREESHACLGRLADFAQGGASSLRMDEAFQRDYRRLLKKYFPFSQRWRPALASALAEFYRALPGVSAPRQTPARAR